MVDWSKTWTWMDGEWFEGNKPLIGLRSQAGWLGSSVFDGARAFEGVIPDLIRHCQRVNRSADILGMNGFMAPEKIAEIAREGVAKFDENMELYIRPMYWAEEGGFMSIVPDPDSTKFAVCIYEMPMPAPTGFSATTTRFQRPTLNSMPVNAKAGCLYPNNGRMLQEARDKGFDNALCCDALGNVAEFASANAFMVKDGKVLTPSANGTFLNGVTRQRVMGLLRGAGTEVLETTLSYDDFRGADEIFSTGNYAKVMPIIKFEERDMQPGPITAKARELYWEFAHS
ncbi:MAG: branched chain amino acid aminotransferase [Hyphomicrobiales bacterium]|nr:branched-chain amino acid aminotransferase [Hyphomicrobiales bacterium]PCJ84728.1 MAG: branched chain amino acid aminotransferase [Hyphomicrobiales bacterium]